MNKLEIINDLVEAAKSVDSLANDQNDLAEEVKLRLIQYGVFLAIRIIADGPPKDGMPLIEAIEQGIDLAVDLS